MMTLVYVLLGAAILFTIQALAGWARKRGTALSWYHWLGFAIVAGLTVFVAAWIGTSLGEGYPKAASVGGLIFGGIDVILIIGLRLLITATVNSAPVKPGKKAKTARA